MQIKSTFILVLAMEPIQKTPKIMANRISITILGGTLAPYSSSSPPPFVFPQDTISETWHLTQDQVQRVVDVPSSIQTTYPNAKSIVDVKYVKANHFNSVTVYCTSTAAEIDTAANT